MKRLTIGRMEWFEYQFERGTIYCMHLHNLFHLIIGSVRSEYLVQVFLFH